MGAKKKEISPYVAERIRVLSEEHTWEESQIKKTVIGEDADAPKPAKKAKKSTRRP